MLQQTERPRHGPPFRQNIAVSRRMQASRVSLGNLRLQDNAAASRKQCSKVSQRMLANMVVARRNEKLSSTINESRCVLSCIIMYCSLVLSVSRSPNIFGRMPCCRISSRSISTWQQQRRHQRQSNQIKHFSTPATLIQKMSIILEMAPTQPDSQLNANPSLPSSLSCSFQRDLCATPDSSNVPLCSNTLVLSSCCRHVPKSHDPGWLGISVNQ